MEQSYNELVKAAVRFNDSNKTPEDVAEYTKAVNTFRVAKGGLSLTATVFLLANIHYKSESAITGVMTPKDLHVARVKREDVLDWEVQPESIQAFLQAFKMGLVITDLTIEKILLLYQDIIMDGVATVSLEDLKTYLDLWRNVEVKAYIW